MGITSRRSQVRFAPGPRQLDFGLDLPFGDPKCAQVGTIIGFTPQVFKT